MFLTLKSSHHVILCKYASFVLISSSLMLVVSNSPMLPIESAKKKRATQQFNVIYFHCLYAGHYVTAISPPPFVAVSHLRNDVRHALIFTIRNCNEAPGENAQQRNTNRWTWIDNIIDVATVVNTWLEKPVTHRGTYSVFQKARNVGRTRPWEIKISRTYDLTHYARYDLRSCTTFALTANGIISLGEIVTRR